MFHRKFLQLAPKFGRTMIFRNMATIKRFYRKTNILACGDKFEITLDQRKLKTPEGRVLEVTSEPLALAIALEWDSQKDVINRSKMHLTALCSTYLDNPHRHSRADIVNYIANYLETDTVLFHSGVSNFRYLLSDSRLEPNSRSLEDQDELYKVQTEMWDPIIQWFCDRYQVDIAKTRSISPPNLSHETKAVLIRHLASYSQAALQGFIYSVDTLKSVILTLAVSDRRIGVEEAVSLSRLEEEFQIAHWGNVEWSHELSKQDLQARLAAATLFIHLNSYCATSRLKEDSMM